MNRYIRILDHLTEGCQIISPEWRYLYVNEAAAAHGNQTKENLLGAKIMDLYSGIENTEVFSAMQRCMDHREQHSMEHEFTYPDGSTRWFSLNIQPDPEGILITSIDITERRHAKEEITQIFTMSMDMLCIADIHTATFTKVNPAFTEILGFSEAELLGKPFLDFIHPDDIEASRTVIDKKLRTGANVINFENRYRCKDGRYRWLSWASHPSTEKGVTYAVARDITELKQQEAALKRSKAILDATGRMAKVGGWELDAKTMDVSWTEETYRIHEVPLGSKPPLEEAIHFFHPDDQKKLSDAIQRALEHGEPYDMETRFITAKGKHLWTRTMCRPQVENGEVVKLFGTFQDITDRKVAAQTLAKSNRGLSVLKEAGKALLRADNEFALIRNICRIIVEVGEYSMAWVGYAEQDTLKRVRPVGHWGIRSDYLDKIAITWDESPTGQGPTGKAIRTQTPQMARDIAADTQNALWRNAALDRGFQSSIALPICYGRNCLGALNIYAPHPDAFNVLEIDLLRQLADELAYGAISLRNKQAHKITEEELRVSDVRYRRLAENSPDMIYRMSMPDGIYEYVSPAAKHIFGYPPEAWYENRRLIKDIIHPDWHPYFKKQWEELLKGNVPLTYEYQVIHKNGDIRWINQRNVAVRDAEGKLLAIEGIVTDITERKKAEEAVVKKDAMLANLASQVPGMLYQFMRAPDGRYAVPYSSDGVMEIFGCSPEDVRNDFEPIFNAIHPEDRPKILQTIDASIKDLSQWKCEYRVQVPGRPIKWVYGNSIPEKRADGSIIWSGYNLDITDRKLAEAEKAKLEVHLRQAQKMESVGRLAGGVAHDFNNMLSVIIGHADMALENMDPSHPLYADIAEIRKAGERSADLTRQLLAFARKQTVSPQVLDLNKTLEGMTKILSRLIGEDIDLLWLPGAGVWTVKIDPSQIDQILANLCVNARDAIVDVGKVTIETGNAEFDEGYCADHPGFIPGEYVLMAVSDDGCGMDKETLENIFDPFYTTKELGRGTGLGLATVYGVVKQNNGFINVYSEPGQGTTFNIYLPRYETQADVVPEKVKRPLTQSGRETILLVEDEPTILKMAKRMLETMGYRVLTARTPGEAIRIAREYEADIHLLMTDVVMPEMNGRDLAGKLRSIHPKLKRLFMSGYTANVIAHHGVLDEGINFIQKPFSREQLGVRVREVLDRIEV